MSEPEYDHSWYQNKLLECYEKISELEKQNEKLRDRFAMAVLTGLLSAPDSYGSYKEFAEYAYAYADAMMKARKT